MESRFSLFFLINNDTICDIIYWGGERRVNSLKINFDKEELEIDGTKITKPFIVSVPHDDGYQRTKVFNHKNGWKAGEKLPCISITRT